MDTHQILKEYQEAKRDRGKFLFYQNSPEGRIYHQGFGRYTADRDSAIRYDPESIKGFRFSSGVLTELA